MTIRYSAGLRNYVAAVGNVANALSGGFMRVFSGAQPASPDTSISGQTALLDITISGGNFAAGNPSTATITLTAVASGASINSITVHGVTVPIGSAVTAGASDTTSTMAATLAAAINANGTDRRFNAAAVGNVVTLTETRNFYGALSGYAVGLNVTGSITYTTTAFTAGNDSSNGLVWTPDGNTGEIAKPSGANWVGTSYASGNAGWFRIFGRQGAGDTLFLDGSIGTAGADLIMLPSVTIVQGATNSINAATITLP